MAVEIKTDTGRLRNDSFFFLFSWSRDLFVFGNGPLTVGRRGFFLLQAKGSRSVHGQNVGGPDMAVLP